MKITKTKLRQLVLEQTENRDAPMQMSMNEFEDCLWIAARAVASGKSTANAVKEAMEWADQPYDVDEDDYDVDDYNVDVDDFDSERLDGGAWEDEQEEMMGSY